MKNKPDKEKDDSLIKLCRKRRCIIEKREDGQQVVVPKIKKYRAIYELCYWSKTKIGLTILAPSKALKQKIIDKLSHIPHEVIAMGDTEAIVAFHKKSTEDVLTTLKFVITRKRKPADGGENSAVDAEGP